MIEATPFTPLSAAVGGLLIGVAATLLMWGLGQIAGISGIVRAALRAGADYGWRWAFLLGMVAAAFIAYHWAGAYFEPRQGYPLPMLLLAGLLVGYGTALGSGCTSGHGVCGVARLSRRSLIATCVFMATGILTAVLTRHGLAGLS